MIMTKLQHTKTLVELAEDILAAAKALEQHLPSSPTFQHDTIGELATEQQHFRKALIDASSEINALARGAGGPLGRIFDMSYSCLDQLVLHAICHFHVPQAVPLDGQISFAEVAGKCNNITENQLTRIIRQGMNLHLFCEPTKGYIAHTADTRLLVQDPSLFDLALTLLENLRPATLKLPEAIDTWPGSESPSNTGWQLAYNTEKLMYETISENVEVQRRFSAHLEQIAKQDPRTGEKLAAMFAWGDFRDATVVDIGGGNGQYSIAIAKEHRDLKFIVQDVPGVSDAGRDTLAEDLRGRVEFMHHDMFTTQPVKGADIYFLRHVFHNWGDEHCVRILKALVPALKRGARVLTCDLIAPETGSAPAVEVKEIRRLDLLMLSLHNAKQREVQELERIFKKADERFDFVGSHGIEGCHDRIFEAIWTGESQG